MSEKPARRRRTGIRRRTLASGAVGFVAATGLVAGVHAITTTADIAGTAAPATTTSTTGSTSTGTSSGSTSSTTTSTTTSVVATSSASAAAVAASGGS